VRKSIIAVLLAALVLILGAQVCGAEDWDPDPNPKENVTGV
jgi:hypothetical protein